MSQQSHEDIEAANKVDYFVDRGMAKLKAMSHDYAPMPDKIAFLTGYVQACAQVKESEL